MGSFRKAPPPDADNPIILTPSEGGLHVRAAQPQDGRVVSRPAEWEKRAPMYVVIDCSADPSGVEQCQRLLTAVGGRGRCPGDTARAQDVGLGAAPEGPVHPPSPMGRGWLRFAVGR